MPWPRCRLRAEARTKTSPNSPSNERSESHEETNSPHLRPHGREKEYELLKKKSAAVGLSANAWLMFQLNTNRPTPYQEQETWKLIRFMDPSGREINAIAKEYNSGYGAEKELLRVVQLLCGIFERIHALRKEGCLYARQTNEG